MEWIICHACQVTLIKNIVNVFFGVSAIFDKNNLVLAKEFYACISRFGKAGAISGEAVDSRSDSRVKWLFWLRYEKSGKPP